MERSATDRSRGRISRIARALTVGVLIAAGCTSPPPVAVPTASATLETAPAISAASASLPRTTAPTPGPGALPFAAQMTASDGVLAAAVRLDIPSPMVARTEIFVAELGPRTTAWRSIAILDAFPTGLSVANGRVAIGLRRETFQGGGAFSAEIVVIDAASGGRSSIWSGSFSAATFRGGGGGPKRVSEKFVLAAGRIAYVRLAEVAGGDLTGELRVRDLGNGRETVIGGSPRWIEPIAFSGSLLAFSIAGDPLDEIRQADLGSGAAVITIVRASLIRAHAYNGRWLLYTTTQSEQAGPHRLVLRDVASGTERTLDAFGNRPSLNETHAVWQSVPVAGASGSSAFKAAALSDLKESTLQRPSLFEARAVSGGVLMHDMAGGFSTISLLALP